MLALFAIINTISGILVRALIRRILHLMRKRGYNLKHILLVGYSRAAEAYIDRIIANPQWGYMVRGILDDNVPRGAVYKGVKVLGSIDNLPFILPENKLDEIAVTLALQDYDRLEEIVNLCEKSGVHTKFIPDYNSLIPGKPYTEDLGGLPGHQHPLCPAEQHIKCGCKARCGYFRFALRIDSDVAASFDRSNFDPCDE